VSNFTFLNNEWPELFETACEAEQNVNSAPLTSFDSAQPPMNARRSLELAVKWLYANDAYLKQPYADNQAALGFDFAQPPVPERSRREPCLFPKILTIQTIFTTRGLMGCSVMQEQRRLFI